MTEAIRDPQDALIVEGYPVLDRRLRGIVVYVMSVITKKQQAARRPAQNAPAG